MLTRIRMSWIFFKKLRRVKKRFRWSSHYLSWRIACRDTYTTQAASGRLRYTGPVPRFVSAASTVLKYKFWNNFFLIFLDSIGIVVLSSYILRSPADRDYFFILIFEFFDIVAGPIPMARATPLNTVLQQASGVLNQSKSL